MIVHTLLFWSASMLLAERIAWWLPAVIALAFVIIGASEFNSAPAAWRMRFTVTDLLWNVIAVYVVFAIGMLIGRMTDPDR